MDKNVEVTVKIQEHNEVLWKGIVTVTKRCWSGIGPGWEDVDEYDSCWDILCDTVSNSMPDRYRYLDWYIYDYKEV